MLGSWIKLLTNDDNDERIKFYTTSHTLIVNFKKPKSNGKYMGLELFNELFFKLKPNCYVPMTHFFQDWVTFGVFRNYSQRKIKLVKYYTNQQYKNIENVLIASEDPYIALPHALILWADYDLLKPYFKNIPIEKIDKTLWAFYYYNPNHHNKYESLLLQTKRFNIIGFFFLLEGSGVPILYRDGVLVLHRNKVFKKNVKLLKTQTTKEAVRNVVKKLSDAEYVKKNLFKNILGGYAHFLMFPYTIVLGLTDYGYVLNLYKFNQDKLTNELLYIKPVILDYQRDIYLPTIKLNMLENKNISESFKFLQNTNTSAGFGFDTEFLYIYEYKILEKPPKVYMLKIPLDKVSNVRSRIDTSSLVHNYLFLTIHYKGGKRSLRYESGAKFLMVTPSESPVFNK